LVTDWVEILIGGSPRGFSAFAPDHADRFESYSTS